MVAGTNSTRHSQLFSKKSLWNEKVAKGPKSSQIKILEPSASQKSQISVFLAPKEPIWQPSAVALENGHLPTTWQESELMFRNNRLLRS